MYKTMCDTIYPHEMLNYLQYGRPFIVDGTLASLCR